MAKTFIIEVPHDVEEEDIEAYFGNKIDELKPAMDLELQDDRAVIDDLDIVHLTLDDDSLHLEYSIEYSAYYGCKDMDYSEVEQRQLSGRRSGRTFEFDEFVPPPRRSTYEEY